MELVASVFASPYDDHYEMALVYCYDSTKKYCFSLSRFPGSEQIKVVVSDQINEKTLDLDVTLQNKTSRVAIEQVLAAKLDGNELSVIDLKLPDEEIPNLKVALCKIFEGNNGIRVTQ